MVMAMGLGTLGPREAICGLHLACSDRSWHCCAQPRRREGERRTEGRLSFGFQDPEISNLWSAWTAAARDVWSLTKSAPDKRRECLPTLKQLRIRRVDVQALCPICRDAYESIEHALLLCTQPKLVWDRVGIGTAIAATGASSFLDWCIQSFATADADKRKLLPVLCWAIWSARNDFVWQQKTTTAATILNTATGFLDQWSKAQNTLIETSWSSYTIHDGAEQWVVPSENKIKVNVDAALFNSSNKYGCGFVARDHYGMLVQGKTLLFTCSPSPELAESIGIREALSWIKSHG
uniref:Reverse transcriptase zinc-binding domain-containing protein n=1 Tax=Cannabis sativa TaxID=3483 RepID=A0A803Q6N0_CANSA